VGLDRQIQEAFAEARQVWPSVDVPLSAFAAYVSARLPSDDVEALEGLRKLHLSDLFLACGCASGLAAAIDAFRTAFFGDARGVLRGRAAQPDFVEEVQQRLLVKLLVPAAGARPRIAEYSGRGDLRHWFRVVATREALTVLRASQRERSLEGDDPSMTACSAADPELGHLRARYSGEFQTAFAEAAQKLSPEDRNLLRYHYLDQLSIDRIGAIYRIHRMTAARRLTKVRQKLVDCTRATLAERLRASDSELRSVLRLLRSDMHVSIRRVLQEPR
jgi:RNA polymerase sigma-70 factor (ECF subfamily)